MLNFKHIPFVHSDFLHPLFSEISSSRSFRKNFSDSFEDWLRLSDGACGVLTLSFDSGSSLEEVAAVGYKEDGFFYSFLARSTGNLDRLNREVFPLWFSAKDHELFHPDSAGCLVAGIRGTSSLEGFFLAEFPVRPPESIFVLWALLAQKLSAPLESNAQGSVLQNRNLQNSPRTDLFRKEGVGEFLAELSVGKEVFSEFRQTGSWVRILGASGSGKKTLGKWLHRSVSPDKGILVLGFLPEQNSKLEKSLEDWIRMTNSGTIVLEGIQKFTSNQQKFFYQILTTESRDFRLIFTESTDLDSSELYKPFRELLKQKTISIPAFSELQPTQKESFVLLFLEELKEFLGREDLTLSSENLQKILALNLETNLSGLRNLLEESILNSSGSEIGIREKKVGKERILALPDSEDLDLRSAVEAVERQKILLANKLFGGNQIRMARALGISRGSLQYKLKQLEIG
ncbi:Fis family transcriptional regulator [Leptospira gomenensis]|uniref:Fis family transcriptional regulator n=1 Tax=Leptospira gomenensis TaxID=2484974 RepID=A0A5F1YEX8_9LEPT|nr:helix-turn-helix domain-containing protein [Leptospira gomenensis]TGK38366.1 Fis family transcriptional regulator [Leptospira gomenensis]TGK39287.1 Fis family transcriptional regulator [Leptospira gomenensis]TGK52180.1 Fis family transcriptional regulator [Leptospira gomenensis]TGK62966.1 Fis family transcriptional regulator [Leptospira gomenensis]